MPPGTNYRLHQDCVFVQLDNHENPSDVRSVVFRHRNGITHYTPENEAARIVLEMLARNAGQPGNDKGTSYEDIVAQLVQTFRVTTDQAGAALEAFLQDLRNFDLLEERPHPIHVPIGNYPLGTDPKGVIVQGGSVITCGYVITWYRC